MADEAGNAPPIPSQPESQDSAPGLASQPESQNSGSNLSSRPESHSDAAERPEGLAATAPAGHVQDDTSQAFALEAPASAPQTTAKRPAKKEPEEASQSPFNITVGKVYDGPMDLLLDLIRKQNIDIYDIPIGRITAQFLEYTRHLQQTDIDAAGEFIYVASLLIHIKSKTLLPRDPTSAQGELAVDDPRRELVERLLEHERFKAAAQMLMQKQQIEEASWTQPGLRGFLRDEGEESISAEREIAADTVDLVRVFGDLLQRLRDRPVHRIDEESVTVAQMIDYVKRRLLMEDRPMGLRRLLGNVRSERALICTFLAMLELVRLQAILLLQVDPASDILLKKAANFDQVMADTASARDDYM